MEHIVQDSCSDERHAGLAKRARVKAFIEKDAGMYDAVNRGFVAPLATCSRISIATKSCRRAGRGGGIFSGSIRRWKCCSRRIVTDGDGNYICHRHGMVPVPINLVSVPALTTQSSSAERHQRTRPLFDTKWRDLGDFHWVAWRL